MIFSFHTILMLLSMVIGHQYVIYHLFSPSPKASFGAHVRGAHDRVIVNLFLYSMNEISIGAS